MSTAKDTIIKPTHYDYDAIVIGTGPGGEGAAMQLAKGGARIAVIERYKDIGGGCTHWGTIPSKALRHSVSQLIELQKNALFLNNYPQNKTFTFKDVLRHTEQVIAKQVKMRSKFYNRKNCTLYFGHATFDSCYSTKGTTKLLARSQY